ncbi:MAG: 16S rRNA (uracil(1498)-N(3))-methyltransferase [Candidatus Syntrophosphaera sp.]|nr:16S rRNA (uracil(1498)-N(3))-methyltransferase [Candidatus Syntrophosphaera sp.]
MPSIYLPGSELLRVGDTATLEGDEFHHLARVAHRRLQDPLLLNSGRGTLSEAQLLEVAKHSARLEITAVSSFPQPQPSFAIAFALLRNRHDELIVEKCTELGAAAFFPLVTEHSVRQASDNTLQRFHKTALAAVKQCDNPWLPEVLQPQGPQQALDAIRDRGYTPILCSERRPDIWLHHLSPVKTGNPCFLIGAEGGWSEAEFALFEGLEEITLGDLVTRAETAAISVAAQWLAYLKQKY